MYKIEYSNRFKCSYKLAQKRGLPVEELLKVVKMLSVGETLPPKYKDHALKGKYSGLRECHIQPDWLLIYKIENEICVLYLIDTGTHSDLFR